MVVATRVIFISKKKAALEYMGLRKSDRLESFESNFRVLDENLPASQNGDYQNSCFACCAGQYTYGTDGWAGK
jgi:hypothetical protein